MKHTECYIKGYPRPQFVRKDFEILCGEWDFEFDEDNKFEHGNIEKIVFGRKINVPYVYSAERSGIGIKKRCDNVWYRRDVDFSAKIKQGKRAVLVFEGADYCAKLWVNGCFIGQHTGGYDRFSFDITDSLKAGKGRITVKCEDNYSCMRPRGKQKWKDDNFECWYTETTGIYKTVWADFVPPSHIGNVRIESKYEDNSVTFSYRIANAVPGLKIEARVSYEGQLVAAVCNDVVRESFSVKTDIVSESIQFGTHAWSGDRPYLYDVIFALYSNGKEIDRVGSYFGVNKYSCNNDYITINDTPVYLKMILDQGYFSGGGLTATEEELENDIRLITEYGFNGIRMHQKIEDERFYYLCDVYGVYCWLEMPSAYEFGDDTVEALTSQWLRIVRQYANHPSVMALIPFNESWGVPRIYSDKRQQDFTVGIYKLSKTLAPELLVVSNDGWEHTVSDIVTVHQYADTGKELKEIYSDFDRTLRDQKNLKLPYKSVFAKGYEYNGQPVILSEFGGIAFEKDRGKGWGYGHMESSEDAFFERLESLIAAIGGEPAFSGYCLTQFTDVEQEINGIVDIDRKSKVDKERLAQIIKSYR